MLEPDGLDKAARSLQEKYLKEFDTAVRLFEDAFADLPKHMKDAFGKTGKEFFQFTDQAGKRIDVLGKTVKEVKANLSALKSKLAVAKELVSATFREAEANDKMTKQMIKQARTADQLLAAEKMRAQLLDDSADKFERLVNQQRALSHMEDAMLTKMKALKIQGWATAIGNGVKAATYEILKSFTAGYQQLRKAGFDGAQAMAGVAKNVISGEFKNLGRGVFTNPAEFAKAYGGVANQLGNTNVGTNLVGDVAELTKYQGVGADAAAKMMSSMYRYSGYSETAVRKQKEMVNALGVVNHMPIGTVFRDMANNSEAMAMYAGRGTAELAKGLISARKLGVEFKDMSRFAGSLVDDFESSVQMQAEIQTVMPGMDFSEMMYASQFGTDEQFQDAAMRAFQGSGIKSLDQLPRSVRDMIVNKTGQSAENIQKLLNGQSPNVQGANGTESNTGLGQTADRLASSIGDIISNSKLTAAIFANVAALVGNTTALIAGKGMSGGIGSMMGIGRLAAGGGIGALGGLLGRAGGVAALGMGAFDVGSSLFDDRKDSTKAALDRHKFLTAGTSLGAGIGAFGGGVGAIPGALLGAGVGGLMDWGANSFGLNYFHAQDGPQVQGMATPSSGTHEMHPIPVDTGRVEGLLAQLIKAVEAGHTINLDGREVGKGIVKSYSRE